VPVTIQPVQRRLAALEEAIARIEKEFVEVIEAVTDLVGDVAVMERREAARGELVDALAERLGRHLADEARHTGPPR
jgi:hypothetical protein